jgi:hypothetical protein
MHDNALAGEYGIEASSLLRLATWSQMREMIGKLVLNRPRRSIVERVFQNDARNSGVLIVQWDEWIPSLESYFERNIRIAELHFSERVFSLEHGFSKARKPLETATPHSLPLEALIENLEDWKGSFNEFGGAGRPFDVQNGKGRLRRVGSEASRQSTRLWAATDGKILQPTVTV